MLAIKLTFTANRYHATPWGRHVNEGVAEWPPSPWRLLRGISASWLRTCPDLPPDRVAPLLEALASQRPHFRLPQASTAHTRHYMPYNEGARQRLTLVIDSFVAIKPQDPMFVLWPELELSSQQQDDLNAILCNMPYLGRAESWIEAELVSDSECPEKPNSQPLETGAIPPGWEIVRTLIPNPPLKLKDLLVETSELRQRGRIDPEGAQWWTYVRRPDCFTEFRAVTPPTRKTGAGAQVIRFVLDANPLPMSTATLRWGELARAAAMSQYGRQNRGAVSPTLSGKDRYGKPLQGHRHAFYLPTDEIGDGRLDHLTIWANQGFTAAEFQAVVSIKEINPGGQQEPLRPVYQSHGSPDDFIGVSPLFGKHRHWRSLTPYSLPRHVKFRGPRDAHGLRAIADGPEEQIAREISLRWPNGPRLLNAQSLETQNPIEPILRGQSGRFRPADFFRYRKDHSSGGGAFNFLLEFDEPLSGPVALGFACHYGLGIFIPAEQ